MESLLNVAEAAKLLRISENTLRDLTKAGKLKAVRISGSWRSRPASLEAYIRAHEGTTEKYVRPWGAEAVTA